MKKQNLTRTQYSALNIVTSIGGQLLATILKFVVRTVFIQTLGKSYLGINGLFADILQLLSLTELGFDTAINFKLYKPLAEGDSKRVRLLLKFYKQAYIVIGTVILILGLILIPFLPVLIKDYDSLAVLGINAVLIFLLHVFQIVSSYWFFAYRSAIMKASQRTYVLDLSSYVITILDNIAKILILIYLKNFVVYIASTIAFSILQNYVNAFIAKHYYPDYFIKEEDNLSKEEVKDLFKDCGALFIYKVNNVVVKATDNTVMSAFIGLGAVAMYSNYLLFYNTINGFFDKVYGAVNASMGNLFVSEGDEKKYKFFQVMNFASVILFGTAGAGVAVCANELIRTWIGTDYVIPQPFAILVGIEILFHGLKINLGQIRNVSGVFQQMWYRPLLGIFVNLGVSIWLVHVCGIYGIIIGTITADLLTNFLVDPRVLYKYSFNNYRPVSEYYTKNLLYLFILFTVTAADMWVCNHFFLGHGWLSVIVHSCFVGLSVPAVLTLFFHRTHEFRYLLQIVQRLINKVLRRRK